MVARSARIIAVVAVAFMVLMSVMVGWAFLAPTLIGVAIAVVIIRLTPVLHRRRHLQSDDETTFIASRGVDSTGSYRLAVRSNGISLRSHDRETTFNWTDITGIRCGRMWWPLPIFDLHVATSGEEAVWRVVAKPSDVTNAISRFHSTTG